MKVKSVMLVPLAAILAILVVALTLIVGIVIRSPYTHQHIMAMLDPNYNRTPLAFVGEVAETRPLPSILDREVSFSREVLPILKNSCAACHRPLKNSAPPEGVDLTSYEKIMKLGEGDDHGEEDKMMASEGDHDGGNLADARKGDGHDEESEMAAHKEDDHEEEGEGGGDGHGHGALITPGKPEESMLVEVLRNPRVAMPPIITAPLSEEEKQIIATWVAQGAKNN